MTGFLKFLAGVILSILGFFGLLYAIFGFLAVQIQQTLQHTPIATWPLALIGVIAFLMLIGGIYILRHDP
jgi:hypothetical protein